MSKRRLLWIGDACVSTGFARSTHQIVPALAEKFDVSVLALNYHGDPHPEFPYDCYTCWPGGDMFGVGRVRSLVKALGPAVIVLQQDPWNVRQYVEPVAGIAPVIGVIPVDGKNCRGTELNGLAHSIFWTDFGRTEAKLGGYTGPSTVIPLGVDLNIYKPSDRAAERERMKLPQVFEDRGLSSDVFIVGVVGRNQSRKRLDLTIQYFAEWVHSRQVNDAVLWLHVAPTGDAAYDIDHLARYYNVVDRVVVPDIEPRHGLSETGMARVYSVFDVLFSTTHGEGMGLPALEAMACSVGCVLPDWSGYGDWAPDGSLMVKCTSTAAAPGFNTIGGVMDGRLAVETLHRLYTNRKDCQQLGLDGLDVAKRPRYRWDTIGQEVLKVVEETLYQTSQPDTSEPVWKDLGREVTA